MIRVLKESLPSEKDALIRLVRGVVLAQGNVFIKELLRSRGIKIGTTKAEFEANMVAAIQNGELQRHHIDSWLGEVEGWGNQHVYLLSMSKALSEEPFWRDVRTVESKMRSAGFGDRWNSSISLEYPSAHTLTGVYFDAGVLTFVWHKGLSLWIRHKDKDYREEEDGDTYEFRAYRMSGDRVVTRFQLRPLDGLAAVFLQIAVDEEEHKTTLEIVKSTIDRIWSFNEFEPFPIANAIKKLDTRSLEGNGIIAQSTRLSSGEAYVEFGARSASLAYQDSTAVRQVRKSVQARSFTGASGRFTVPLNHDSNRRVRLQMFGAERRIKIASQLTADQVWEILSLVAANV